MGSPDPHEPTLHRKSMAIFLRTNLIIVNIAMGQARSKGKGMGRFGSEVSFGRMFGIVCGG